MSVPSQKRNSARIGSCLLTAIALAGVWCVLGSGVAGHAMKTDFLNLYTGASLALEGRFGELHETETQFERERSLVADTPRLVPFVRPHLYAAMLAPLALMPLGRAFAFWIAVQIALMCAITWWAWRRFGVDAVVCCAMFPPIALGIAHGQDNSVMLAILTTGWVLREKGRERAAGLVWSLLLIKFHLILGIVGAALWMKDRRVVQGLMSGGAAFGVISIALGGRSGVAAYLRMLQGSDLPGLYPGREKLANFQGIAASFGLPEAMAFAVIASLVAVAGMVALKGASRALGFGVCLAGALALTPHVYVYDLSLLLLPLVALFTEAGSGAVARASGVLLSPLVTICTLFDPPWCAITPAALLCWLGVVAWASAKRRTATSPAIAQV